MLVAVFNDQELIIKSFGHTAFLGSLVTQFFQRILAWIVGVYDGFCLRLDVEETCFDRKQNPVCGLPESDAPIAYGHLSRSIANQLWKLNLGNI